MSHRGCVATSVSEWMVVVGFRVQGRWQGNECEKQEDAEEEERRLASTLPSVEKLDKILRYETTLERQLYRAMNQLERLQRRRMGEKVAPPIAMEVSHQS